jgi:hypothetical protein
MPSSVSAKFNVGGRLDIVFIGVELCTVVLSALFLLPLPCFLFGRKQGIVVSLGLQFCVDNVCNTKYWLRPIIKLCGEETFLLGHTYRERRLRRTKRGPNHDDFGCFAFHEQKVNKSSHFRQVAAFLCSVSIHLILFLQGTIIFIVYNYVVGCCETIHVALNTGGVLFVEGGKTTQVVLKVQNGFLFRFFVF